MVKSPPPKYVQLPSLPTSTGLSGTQLLEIERKKASFSSSDLASYIHGEEYLQKRQAMVELLENDETGAFDKSKTHYLGRTDKFRAALRKDKRMAVLGAENNWTREDTTLAESLIDTPGPFGLHKSMFLTTLQNMGTDEQREAFLVPAQKYEIIGCYAQTELGHGSNVQGLETIATYDPETKMFDIHSPSLTASKWWIGGLGRSADHCVCMARLIIDGKNMGPHPFVVPIRDVKSREPLPGCTIGDIGPKFGYQTTDNGFLLLDHVKIPHFNMLARYSSIDAETGKYNKPKSAALTYGTLTWVRANIVQDARSVLMRSATVAIRYCAIRRQFADRDAPKYDEAGKPIETQVLDYTMVQYRLFPILAQAFAFHYTSKFMFDLYNQNQRNVEGGDLSLLADTHASSSGLKSLCTIMAANAIEECRRACGGHGFSLASGLGSFYSDYLPNVTWEGDSYMLTQQCTRYLFKQMRTLKKNREKADKNITTDYMIRYLDHQDDHASIAHSGDLYDPLFFCNAFGHRAAYLTEQTLSLRDNAKRSWNSLLVELYKCSKAHSQYLLVRNFSMAILKDDKLNHQHALRQVMQKVYLLFCCHTMEQEGADFLASGYISSKQYALLNGKVQELFVAIRPEAIGLCDSFAIPDYVLNSALGRSDGKVYESLFDFAIREPLNSTRWNVDVNDLETLDMDDTLPRPKL